MSHERRRGTKVLLGWTVGWMLAGLGCGIEEVSLPDPSDRATGVVAPTTDPVGHPYVLVPPSDIEAVLTLVPEADPEQIALEYDLEVLDVVDIRTGWLVRYDNPLDADVQLLRDDPDVMTADRNLEVTMGEIQTLVLGFLEGGWNPGTVAQQNWIEDLELAEVHAQATGNDVLIAILDTGAYSAHPLLAGHTIPVPDGWGLGSEEYPDQIDNDGDGQLDEAFGHGTHVAGCVALVAPGATILPIKVITDDGVGCLWDILRGMELARAVGADVISMSLTLSSANESMEESLQECAALGIAVVCAAGNYGNRHAKYPGTSAFATGVASIGDGGSLSLFSGGGQEIELAAPGELILSAYPRAELWYGTGTSMATPIVAGCIALAMEALDQAPLAAVQSLCGATTPIQPLAGVHYGRVAPASTF